MKPLTLACIHKKLGEFCDYFNAETFPEIVKLISNYRRENKFSYEKIVYFVDRGKVEALVFWRKK